MITSDVAEGYSTIWKKDVDSRSLIKAKDIFDYLSSLKSAESSVQTQSSSSVSSYGSAENNISSKKENPAENPPFSTEITSHTLPFALPDRPKSTTYTKKDLIRTIIFLCEGFKRFAKQIGRERRKGKKPFSITDEYDVQDALHALLKLHFDDVRPEEWTPSYTGASKRMDFLLKGNEVAIEVKMTRSTLKDAEIGNEITLDVPSYRNHHDCKILICFVYDPDNHIVNPTGVKSDLEQSSDHRCEVIVIITN